MYFTFCDGLVLKEKVEFETVSIHDSFDALLKYFITRLANNTLIVINLVPISYHVFEFYNSLRYKYILDLLFNFVQNETKPHITSLNIFQECMVRIYNLFSCDYMCTICNVLFNDMPFCLYIYSN